jgi:2,5-diketo-D-gluconate reductase B
MEYFALSDGTPVPTLGFGTSRLLGAEAREGVAHALALGYRHVDTARAYENEAEVGAGLRASGVPRSEVWLTTKVWQDQLRAPDVRRSAEASLRDLGTDYVDLLLVHWPNPDIPLAETLGALQTLRAEGKARHLGVSNFPPGLLREAFALQPDLVTDQVEYHPYLAQDALLGELRPRGAFLTAYTPLAKGAVLEDPVIREIAEAHGKSPVQVTLRWFLQQEGVAAIPKAASARHREANLAVFDFALSDDEMDRIHGLARGHRLSDPDWGPDWED